MADKGGKTFMAERRKGFWMKKRYGFRSTIRYLPTHAPSTAAPFPILAGFR